MFTIKDVSLRHYAKRVEKYCERAIVFLHRQPCGTPYTK